MDIKKLLEDYNLTQHEIADFTGIPRGRIQKWIEKNIAPPKALDLKTMEIAANYFAVMPAEKVKGLVKTHRIIMGNVEPINRYKETTATGIVAEPESPYNKQQKQPLDTNPPPKTGDLPMLNERILNMLERSIANEERTTIALENISRTNEHLSGMLATIMGKPKRSQAPAKH